MVSVNQCIDTLLVGVCLFMHFFIDKGDVDVGLD